VPCPCSIISMGCHVFFSAAPFYLKLFVLDSFYVVVVVAQLTPGETFAARFVAAAASSTRQILTQFVAKFSGWQLVNGLVRGFVVVLARLGVQMPFTANVANLHFESLACAKWSKGQSSLAFLEPRLLTCRHFSNDFN